jgi:hypothetical protein
LCCAIHLIQKGQVGVVATYVALSLKLFVTLQLEVCTKQNSKENYGEKRGYAFETKEKTDCQEDRYQGLPMPEFSEDRHCVSHFYYSIPNA